MENQFLEKDEMREIIDEFIVEAGELTEKAIQDVIVIENNPDEEMINSMFRAVHTVKGTSSFLGFNALSTLAHRAEDILGMVRKGDMAPDHMVADALLEALDLIKTLLEEIKESSAEQSDTAPTIEKLEALKNPDKKKPEEVLKDAGAVKAEDLPDVSKEQEGAQIGKEPEKVPVCDAVATEAQVSNLPNKQKTQAHKEESTIRIEVKKLDDLMNLAGELVLGKNRLILLNNMVKKSDANK